MVMARLMGESMDKVVADALKREADDLEEQKTKSQKDYQRCTALVKAAGWKSLAEFQKAVLSGAVTIPAK